MNFESIEKVEEYLVNIPKFQSEGATAARLGLERFREFCEALGNPHHQVPAIHVAGTNGKGSTCHILDTLLRKAGYQTGLYTSPHIHRFADRVRINGNSIPVKELLRFFQQYERELKAFNPSYFEISTAIAFWWFSENKVDVAIIETGLGGRLDATNIISPVVSVITSVALDHTAILGETLEEVAREKAGIIKADTPVVVGDIPEKAGETIAQIAEQKGSTLYTITNVAPQSLGRGQYQLTLEGEAKTFKSNLMAPVQAKNLAIAWQVVQAAEPLQITAGQFIKAVETVDMGPGRFSQLTADQSWYFDGGHNIEAVKALKDTIQTIGSTGAATLVLALMRDKIRPDVMAEFSEFKKIYYYPLDLKRAASFEEIKKWLPHANLFPFDQNRQQLILKDFDSELVIFAGSFYFYTTVQDWIKNCA